MNDADAFAGPMTGTCICATARRSPRWSKFTAERFGRAIVMPNLKPPVATDGRGGGLPRAHSAPRCRRAARFEPLMTLYLTDATVARGNRPRRRQRVRARREALSGRRDHAFGCRRHRHPQDLCRARAHAEASACRCWCTASRRAPDVDVFDRETAFIDETARAAARALSAARKWCSSTSPRHARSNSSRRRARGRRRHHHAAASAA